MYVLLSSDNAYIVKEEGSSSLAFSYVENQPYEQKTNFINDFMDTGKLNFFFINY